MLTNAHIERDSEGNYWLRVQSETGKSASLNLSNVSNSELTTKALEEWAKQQMEIDDARPS